jgi:hypothetical protein
MFQRLARRLEFKYRIDERVAAEVRSFVRGFLELDRYGVDGAETGYSVNSCYLDSKDLHTFWHTVNGSRDRFKLRVRTYGDGLGDTAFLEVKRRVDGFIEKSRALVHRGGVEGLLGGRLPAEADVVKPVREQMEAAEYFVRAVEQIHAVPTAFVRYRREAWCGEEGDDRLTMDREVCVWPVSGLCWGGMTSIDPARPFGETVILEMKFSNGKPRWFSDIERVLGLERTSAAKYCDGILTRGIERFSPEGGMSPLACGERELRSVDEKRAKRFSTVSGREGTGRG